MRKLTIILIAFFMISCSSKYEKKIQELQNQLQNQQELLKNTYKPGFGDLMGGLQNHHNKLWFAGTNENWELADFALHEIEEIVEDIKMLHANREETQSIFIIEPALEAMDEAVDNQNLSQFKEEYINLTNACNTCHKATGYEFISIQTPTLPSYTNQDFSRLIKED
mgnify:CR=1 FL=1